MVFGGVWSLQRLAFLNSMSFMVDVRNPPPPQLSFVAFSPSSRSVFHFLLSPP